MTATACRLRRVESAALPCRCASMAVGMHLVVAVAWCALLLSNSFAATVTYTMQTANFNQFRNQNSAGGWWNNTATEIGMWANGGGGNNGAAGFQTFTTTGSGSGTARPLQIGDEFTITTYSANNPWNWYGISFNDSTTYAAFTDLSTTRRMAWQLDSSGNYKVIRNGGDTFSDQGVNADRTLKVKMTASDTFTARIGGTNLYDLPMLNAPGAAARIQSFCIYVQQDNGNKYWKNGSLENTLAVEFGGDNGTRTIAGRIADGLVANSTATVSANSLYKIGTGTITLSDPSNSYTGKTQIEAGTLCISNDTNLGTAPATVTKGHLKFFNNASLRALETMTLSATRGIESPDVGETFFLGVAAGKTLTYAGSISGGTATTYCVKNYPGTLQLTGTNAFLGQLVIDTGTLELNIASGVVLSNEFIRLGAESGSDNVVLTLNSSSGLEVRKGLVVRATGGSKTINNAAGNNLISQAVFLDGNVTSVVTAGRLTYSGAEFDLKSQTLEVSGAGDTLISSTVKGSGKVVKSGAGKLILSGANTYSGTTVINAGTLAGTGSVTASAVTLNSGVRVAPGMSVGNLRTGALTMNAGTSYDWEYSNTTSDWIGAQTLTLPSGAGTANSVTLAISRTEAVTYPVTRPLFTYSSFTPAQTNALYFDLTAVAADTLQPPTLSFNGNSLLISLVPEPAALALLAMLLCGVRLKGFRF